MKTLNKEHQKLRLIPYLRRSQDERGRQERSLEDQKMEAIEYASQNPEIELLPLMEESMTAKIPGRPVFNKVIELIRSGVADGILAWHPDRLARNSIDGGLIIYMLDTGEIKDLKFVSWRFENTPQGKYDLYSAFARSKHFSDKLAVDVKRGLHRKAKEGIWPSFATLGYKNNKGRKTIYVDKKRAPLIKMTFEIYGTGKYSLKKLRMTMSKLGLKSKTGKVLSIHHLQTLLKNPFYYGIMNYGGEYFEGTHRPLISKKLFDQVQEVTNERKQWKNRKNLKYFLYRGLFRCGECGYSITAMRKIKKSGRQYTYYLCTREDPRYDCTQKKYTSECMITTQCMEAVQKVSIPDNWADWMVNELKIEKRKQAQDSGMLAHKSEGELKELDTKLSVLIDALVDTTLSRDEFLIAKNKIIERKKELIEKMEVYEQIGDKSLELSITFIKSLKQRTISKMLKSRVDTRYFLKKIALNPIVTNNKLSLEYKMPYKILAETEPERSEGEVVKGKFKKSSLLCAIVEQIGTHFQENPDSDF